MVANLVYNASENLAEALDIVPDERVLDVACGSGNGAIAAARRTWGGTVGADYVPGAARARPRARRGRAARGRVRRGRRPGPALRGRQLRRRDVDLRRDVRPRPAEDRGRAAARGQAGRPDRDGQLDPRRRRRHDVQDDRQARAAAARARLAAALGHRGAPARAVRRRRSPTCASSAASRASRSARPTTTSSSSAPTSARPRWPTNGSAPRAKQALTDDLRAFLEAANTAGDRAMVLEAEYLEVIATRAAVAARQRAQELLGDRLRGDALDRTRADQQHA